MERIERKSYADRVVTRHDRTRRRLDSSSSLAECWRVRRRARVAAAQVEDRWPEVAAEWRRLAGYAARRAADIARGS